MPLLQLPGSSDYTLMPSGLEESLGLDRVLGVPQGPERERWGWALPTIGKAKHVLCSPLLP